MTDSRVASDIMISDMITAHPDTPCDALMQILIENRITGIPVVDDDGDLVGIITMRDILKVKVDMPYAPSMFDTARGFTANHMTRRVYVVTPDTPLEAIAQEMFQHKIHRVVVVDSDNPHKPVGILTTFDMLKVFSQADFEEKSSQETDKEPCFITVKKPVKPTSPVSDYLKCPPEEPLKTTQADSSEELEPFRKVFVPSKPAKEKTAVLSWIGRAKTTSLLLAAFLMGLLATWTAMGLTHGPYLAYHKSILENLL